ncbi:hypothetical protein IW144_004879, partial [Coemansia sp. RSA 522]
MPRSGSSNTRQRRINGRSLASELLRLLICIRCLSCCRIRCCASSTPRSMARSFSRLPSMARGVMRDGVRSLERRHDVGELKSEFQSLLSSGSTCTATSVVVSSSSSDAGCSSISTSSCLSSDVMSIDEADLRGGSRTTRVSSSTTELARDAGAESDAGAAAAACSPSTPGMATFSSDDDDLSCTIVPLSALCKRGCAIGRAELWEPFECSSGSSRSTGGPATAYSVRVRWALRVVPRVFLRERMYPPCSPVLVVLMLAL